jgi:Flp pilus assembly protein TadD
VTLRRGLLILLLLLVPAAWWGFRAVEAFQCRSELAQAQQELAARRLGSALARLVRLAERWPGRGDVEYLLGACEMARGHPDAALAAWNRVPAEAQEGPLAALSIGRHALKTGRYGLSEKCLERASRAGGDVGREARRLLGRLYWITGRVDQQKRLLRDDAEHARDPTSILQTLWAIDHDFYPIEGVSQALAEANHAAPDDDRVWLATADLAMRQARYDEAADLLARCEKARPNDAGIWRARLEWAKSAAHPDEFLRAASHLPGSNFTQAEVLGFRAWLAAQQGDTAAERTALLELIALKPADDWALERLADLAAAEGDLERTGDLRRRKAAVDAARDRYITLIKVTDIAPHVAKLARAAEDICRWFEAKCWWRLAAQRDPAVRAEAEAALERLAKADPASGAGGRSLADLIGPLHSHSQARTAIRSGLIVPEFADEAKDRGLNFTFDNGRTADRQLPETMSGGIGVLDCDGDGWLDVYAVQGGPFPPPADHAPSGDRLFRNRGDGRFEDVTAKSGLASLAGGYGHGVAVGDYDNDGRPDLFITRWHSYALYHNLGSGRFEDVTASAGLGGNRDWPTSAAWADLDNDGDLDLYVCHYLEWDAANPVHCTSPTNPNAGFIYCDPRQSPALPDHVFRNDRGRFVDVTAEAGITDRDGRGLGVVAADLDGDGRIDLFVANDTTANYFFRNQGGFRFVDQGLESGLAASASGGNLAGMGIACGDFDGDGRPDLAVTNFYGQSTTLYHNHGDGLFSDRATEAGLAAATRFVLGFGLAALDANNDGRLDLAQANGHVVDYRPSSPYAMPAQLFLGDGAGKLLDVSARAGAGWQVPRLGRGLALGDIDNDGRIDGLIVAENEPLVLLHNRSAANGFAGAGSKDHFLMLELEGAPSNRDAVGAVVTVTAGGKTQVKPRFGGGSYLSASDHRLHFGLGDARKVDRIEVAWPSGRHDRYEGVTADTGYHLREGAAAPSALRGFDAKKPGLCLRVPAEISRAQ